MEKLISVEHLKWNVGGIKCGTLTVDYLNWILDHEEPAVDAVPVIRCKDCKYWSTETEQTAVPNMHKCTWWRTIGTLPIDFCSRADRRGEHDKID